MDPRHNETRFLQSAPSQNGYHDVTWTSSMLQALSSSAGKGQSMPSRDADFPARAEALFQQSGDAPTSYAGACSNGYAGLQNGLHASEMLHASQMLQLQQRALEMHRQRALEMQQQRALEMHRQRALEMQQQRHTLAADFMQRGGCGGQLSGCMSHFQQDSMPSGIGGVFGYLTSQEGLQVQVSQLKGKRKGCSKGGSHLQGGGRKGMADRGKGKGEKAGRSQKTLEENSAEVPVQAAGKTGKLTLKAAAMGLTPNEMSDLAEEEFKRRRDAHPEPTRREQPLELLRERATDPQNWSDLVANEHLRSWMTIKHEPAVTMEDYRELSDRVPWLEFQGEASARLTRRTMWYTRNGCTCSYQYGKARVTGSPMPPWLEAMMRRWFASLRLSDDSLPNCLNLNLYENGRQNVSWHADDEPLFQGKLEDTRIISVSLGETRTFDIGLRAPRRGGVLKPEKGSIQSFDLSHGHICTMEGRFQKHYLHQLGKGSKGASKGARINVTFRYIKNHQPGCPLGPAFALPESLDSQIEAKEPCVQRVIKGKGSGPAYFEQGMELAEPLRVGLVEPSENVK
eukprot:TRINITY_DN3586_c0_g1_i2.p1 TRINITY_DN3586_c0_g1~~TRINITY_DN3586_c0_g1_i2.p1  ORF type:complete len:608 (-),score=112.27 TRINITY_DN3586_c0_g1_i2:7-1713(-)